MLVPNVETMTLKEITDLLEVRHDNAMNVVGNMLDNPEFGHAPKIQYRTSRGNEYETYQLNKRQSIAVAAKLNTSLLMRIIDRWQELENREANRVPVEETTKLELLFIESFSRTCNVSESGKLGMYRRLAKNRGLDVKLLPGYAVDEPKGTIATGSSEPTNSLTELLKEHGVKKENGKFYRAVDINPLLANKGILERKRRKSSSGEDKFFWSLTTTGEAYGKNLTSDSNPRETQPHYYQNKFPELLKLIGL